MPFIYLCINLFIYFWRDCDFNAFSSAAMCQTGAQIQLVGNRGPESKAMSCCPLTLNISAVSQFSVTIKQNVE